MRAAQRPWPAGCTADATSDSSSSSTYATDTASPRSSSMPPTPPTRMPSPATSGPSSCPGAGHHRDPPRGDREPEARHRRGRASRGRGDRSFDGQDAAFPINEPDQEADEAVRLKHRYLDLRRAPLLERMLTRSRLVSEIRRVHEAAGFVDIETPILVKSTPEGARDFIVPPASSRAASTPCHRARSSSSSCSWSAASTATTRSRAASATRTGAAIGSRSSRSWTWR